MTQDKKKQPGFEADLEKLEAIVQRLEDGNLPLEEALKEFEAGIALTRKCEKTLKSAERKIEKLVQTMDGDFETEPFDEDAQEGTTAKAAPAAPATPKQPAKEADWVEEEPGDTMDDLF
ncbi:MAG: exodeoxyribonuclease VII small subunit [Candidatus Hydrogenedens sp.]|jgi:exodeoxyribonuclease VII small subunit|nr:exodeoxyribonuclease VII small subunit [Candidatus Hydrogenedens sp.]